MTWHDRIAFKWWRPKTAVSGRIFLYVAMFGTVPQIALADTELEFWLNGLETLKTQFTEFSYAKDGRQLAVQEGDMSFLSPNLYRCTYHGDRGHFVLADGSHVWVYSHQPEQISKLGMEKSFDACIPALAANRMISKYFDFQAESTENGQRCRSGSSRSNAPTLIGKLKLCFDENLLRRIEVRYVFGNRSVIEYKNLERNAAIAPETFHFSPPVLPDPVSSPRD